MASSIFAWRTGSGVASCCPHAGTARSTARHAVAARIIVARPPGSIPLLPWSGQRVTENGGRIRTLVVVGVRRLRRLAEQRRERPRVEIGELEQLDVPDVCSRALEELVRIL